MEKIVGIIVGAGKSKRFGEDKLFINLKNRPVIYYSLKRIDEVEEIGEIILVVREGKVDFFRNLLLEWNIKKVSEIVVGGEERQNSVYNALKVIESSCDYVLIHDAARPFISINKIKELISFCVKEKTSVILGIPLKDTVKIVNEYKRVVETLDRSKLWLIQTPQIFPYEIICKAHEKALEDGFIGTDDAVLVERLNMPVYVLEGDPWNIKITTKEDLIWIEGILSKLELV